MKKIILSLVIAFISLTASAQYLSNYYPLSIGISAGITGYNGDLGPKAGKSASTFILPVDYNLTPFISIGVEFQKGTIKGADSLNVRYFTNSYFAAIINGKIGLGQVLEPTTPFLNVAKGLYLGTGIGFIKNNQTDIHRTTTVQVGPHTPTTYAGKNKSTGFVLPANFGFNYDIVNQYGESHIRLNLNYQYNYTSGDNLDGYNDGPPSVNIYPDYFSTFTFGVKYSFGSSRAY